METIAVVKRGHREDGPRKKRRFCENSGYEWGNNSGVTTCAASPQNLVAFSYCGKLKPTSEDVKNLYTVYVCDANTPWDIHIVKSSLAFVTVLEWDQSGRYLLVGDSMGNAEIWTALTHLLNEWTRVAHICIQDEPIQAGIFFFNGKRIMASSQNRDSTASYTDKFPQADVAPTTRGFGGRPLEGFLVVGMTGLVQAFVMGGTKGKATNIDVLGGIRLAYKHVDLAWTRNGEILAIACTGNPLDPILYCKLAIKKDDGDNSNCFLDEFCVCSEALTGFFPRLPNPQEMRISGIHFTCREDPSGVYLLTYFSSGGAVQYWELCEQERPVHPLFSSGGSGATRSLQWQCCSMFNTNSTITFLCPSRHTWATAPETGTPQHHLIIATLDGDIVCIQRDTMQQTGQVNVTEKAKYESPPEKAVSTMCFTSTGNALIIFDSAATMFICKLSPVTDPGGPMTVPYAVMALEYCLFTGLDCWDILIGLRPAMLDSVCERLTENFNQQSAGLQQLLHYRLLTMKMAIFRLVPNCSAKAALQYSILMLNSVYSALRSLLRPPPEQFNQERAPADSLTAVLSSKVPEGVTEVDKVLLHLEVKEFTVEASTLITVQHLIQWTATFIIKVLANLPEWRSSPQRGNVCDLLRDAKLVNMMRELLVIFRIWGLIRQSCLPSFCFMENIDLIATLFRILTRLLSNPEPDDSLLDECCQLSSQLVIPDLSLSLPARGLAGPTLFLNSWPLQFEFGAHVEEPISYKFESTITSCSGGIGSSSGTGSAGTTASENELKMDSIRHVYLGSKPHNVRYCSRCKGVSIIKGLTRSAAAKSWDMRWQVTCPCRGMWSRQESDV